MNTRPEIIDAEYDICQRRGHVSSGHGLTMGMGPTWTRCSYCNVYYRFTEPVMVELLDEEPENEPT